MRIRSIKFISAVMVFSFGFVNLVTFSTFTYSTLKSHIEGNYNRESNLVLKHTMITFDNRFRYAEHALAALAKSPAVRLAAASGDREEMGNLLVSYYTMTGGTEYLIFGSADGWYAASSALEMPASYDPRQRIWFTKAREGSGAVHWTDPFLGYVDQRIHFAVVTPLIGEGGRFLGVCAAFYRASAISEEISRSEIGERGYVMLLSRNGQVVANRGDYFIGENPLGGRNAGIAYSGPYTAFEVMLDRSPYRMYAGKLSMNGMIVAAAASRNEIRQRLTAIFLQFFAIEAIIFIGFFSVAYVLIRKWIEPLDRLAGLMNRAEAGDYRVTADLHQYEEVESLAHSFNGMLAGIRTRDEMLKLREAKIRNLAYYDSLTGLPNRAHLLATLHDSLQDTSGFGSRGALFYIDLDRFKIINDTMGHSVGDEVLQEIARKLDRTLRFGQTAARIGGDEFVILLPGIDSPDVVERIAKRVLDVLDSPVILDGKRFDTGASIGIVYYPAHGIDVDQLLRRADLAMYRAKRDGRNAFRVFEQEMDREMLGAGDQQER